ncbi:putative amidase AmiD [Paraliobacillus ryukyuensis]|uniref:Amidase n=1 Tax=Paraliobacillus ryukyuensis TaxID=200904 RepID=A0A366EGU6_9BACI|nr:amidase family protein [Paraliobacillus ryukyuensis]RBP00665.1 amidase [Paraliobacillus ryukyuensis]
MAITISEKNIPELQQALQARETTSVELVTSYLERIYTYDQSGPVLNSIRQVNPDALRIAEYCDENRGKTEQSPLYGIPIVIKNNINTEEKMATTAGSVALKNNYAPEDAFLVKQLRAAGAIILATTNLTEFANFMAYDMPNGYSSLGGQVLNPYGPGHFDVGGSSAGTGSAIAANFAAAGIGTETSGSILSPASSNSLVGIKPTVGLISRTGIIPISHSQDTAGPMTRCVEDAAILLTAIAVKDPEDPAMENFPGNTSKDYTVHLHNQALHGARIGIDREAFSSLSEAEQQVMEQAIVDMTEQGAIIIDSINLAQPDLDMVVMKHEFKHDLNAYLANVSAGVSAHSLADIIQYNQAHKHIALLYNQALLSDSEAMSDDPNDPAYLKSREADIYYSREAGIDKVMNELALDAILSPNNFGAGLPAKAGYPSITVSAGYTPEGKPVGVTFTSYAYQEPTLIALGYSYEQATLHRKQPNLS